mmetsp:Transcript_104182/g.335994  ORF Transcript_104182/g.335994 Transcript_104182/m.335994 type:complete len:496 (+) Transcript_104182:69-1556(+)
MRRRSFSCHLQDYCFGGSFAAGLDNVGLEAQPGDDPWTPCTPLARPSIKLEAAAEDGGSFAAEYAALRKRGGRTDGAATQGACEPKPLPPLKHEASSTGASVANITKSLLGIGMLTLPHALADGTPAVGVGMLLLCGSLSAFSFFMLGYCAHLTGAATLPQLWDATVGAGSAALVEAMIVLDTMLSCVAFTLLIGDYMSKSVAGLLPGLPAALRSRSALVMLIGLGLLLPLCMVRRLSLLRFSSIAGLFCTLYVFLYVVCDFAWFSVVDDGELAPAAAPSLQLRPGGLLRCTAIFSVAFMSHCNAPSFYADLQDRSPSRFAFVSGVAFGTAFLVYAAFGLSGLGRFGSEVPGNALSAYPLSTPVLLMWLGMAFCVTASFPLVFGALWGSVLRLAGRACGRPLDQGGAWNRVAAGAVVLAISVAGAVLKDLSVVVSLCGALSGTALSLVFPGLIMLNMKRRKTAHFVALARGLVAVGTVLALCSTSAVLGKAVLGE